MDGLQLNQIIIGSILKGQRESEGLSQMDIATELEYKNYNYISMLENGRSNIPVKKIIPILQAYRFDKSIIPVFMKKLLPDAWKIICYWIENGEEIPTNKTELAKYDQKIEKEFRSMLKKYNLENYIPLLKQST